MSDVWSRIPLNLTRIRSLLDERLRLQFCSSTPIGSHCTNARMRNPAVLLEKFTTRGGPVRSGYLRAPRCINQRPVAKMARPAFGDVLYERPPQMVRARRCAASRNRARGWRTRTRRVFSQLPRVHTRAGCVVQAGSCEFHCRLTGVISSLCAAATLRRLRSVSRVACKNARAPPWCVC